MAVAFKVTNKWMAPNGLYVFTYSIPFPDGPRSAVGLLRNGYTPSEKSGWTAISTVSANGPDTSGAAGGIGTAANFDRRMAAGDILFDLKATSSRGLGQAPWNSAKQVSQGLWSRAPSISTGAQAQKEAAAFAWGLQKLTASTGGAVAATVGPQSGPPVPSSAPVVVVTAPTGARGGPVMTAGGPVAVVTAPTPIGTTPVPIKTAPKVIVKKPPPPPPDRTPYYIGAVVLVGGIVALLLLD
jgi:hypothetical protein